VLFSDPKLLTARGLYCGDGLCDVAMAIASGPGAPTVDGAGASELGERVRTLPEMASDEELVARSAAGDLESFNQLVLRWERPIYALAYRVIGREEDARDVCQDTFLRAYRSINGFRGQAKFSSWLYRIALNLCRDWIRRQRRTPVVQAPEGVDLIEMAGERGPVESVEDLVARRDLGAIVQRAMRALTDDQREAIVLKEYHGLTFQEIADMLGCPLSTVKTRLYQGLTVLRRELEENGIDATAAIERFAERSAERKAAMN
jgi:RNA polymerase sigma-70 factor, ECF subfamily